MARLHIAFVVVILVLVLQDTVTAKKYDKKQKEVEKKKPYKTEGSPQEAKHKYTKQKRSVKEAEDTEPQEEQLSFVIDKPKKQKVPKFDDPGVEVPCDCKSKGKTKNNENKKKRYVLVDENEYLAAKGVGKEEPALVKEEPVKKQCKSKPKQQQSQSKDQKQKRAIRYVIHEENIVPDTEPEEPKQPKRSKSKQYVVAKEEEKLPRYVVEKILDLEAENYTGNRKSQVIEEVDETLDPLEEEEEEEEV